MKLELKAELLKELALEAAVPSPDIGVRAGADLHHPTFRGRVVTSFASWDLLDLHSRREVTSSVVHAVEQFGLVASAGRFSGGLTPAHVRVEQRIAQFFASDAGLLFSSRNQAILTSITTLCAEGWLVIGNALSPLPVADACALVGAEFQEFENETTLRAILERSQLAKRILLVVESVASVTGEIVLKPEVWTMVEQAGALVIVDESAALGILGLRGAGSAESVPKSNALAARVVSFGSASGLEVTGLGISNEFRELMLRRSRYLRVEPPPPAGSVAGAEKLLDLIEVAISQRERLSALARIVDTALRAQGWRVLGGGDLPILSVWFESLQKARSVQDALLQRGIFVDAIAARSTRKNGAVLRILISAAHTPQEVERMIEGFGEILRRLQSES